MSKPSPQLAAIASLLLPGLGHFLLGRRSRGGSILFFFLVLVGLLAWLDLPLVLGLALIPFWLMSALDSYRLAAAERPNTALLLLLGALPVYLIGWQVTEINMQRVIQGAPRVQPLLAGLVQPRIAEQEQEIASARHDFYVPCPAPAGVSPEPSVSGATLELSTDCGAIGDSLTLTGSNFPPNQTVGLWWVNAVGDTRRVRIFGQYEDFQVDEAGSFTAEIQVPAVEQGSEPRPQEIQVRYVASVGEWYLTQTFRLVAQRMGETIAQALMATFVGALLAMPFSFFGARNLMAGNPLLVLLYHFSRLVMNVLRSIEPLIMAIVFVIWVGLGPFAGVLALVVHTIAALGKLYSESIESIDEGPIEAIRSTGANQLQIIAYGVVPQVVPSWIAFTVYRWDINVRMSTIIGFVGGGGIGFLLAQWIRLQDFRAAATAIWGIALVVILLDYVSAKVRERVV